MKNRGRFCLLTSNGLFSKTQDLTQLSLHYNYALLLAQILNKTLSRFHSEPKRSFNYDLPFSNL